MRDPEPSLGGTEPTGHSALAAVSLKRTLCLFFRTPWALKTVDLSPLVSFRTQLT